jgi:hypothetical protein
MVQSELLASVGQMKVPMAIAVVSFPFSCADPQHQPKNYQFDYELKIIFFLRFTSFLMFKSDPLSVPFLSSRSDVEEVPLP